MPSLLNIITPPATTALTSMANARAELGVDNFDDDIYIAQQIDRSSALIQSWLGRQLGTQTAVEKFRYQYGTVTYYPTYPTIYGGNISPFNLRPLIVSLIPIVSITSIVEDSNPPLVQDVDYEYEPKSGLLWRLSGNSRCQWTGSTTTITYVSGYVLPQDSGTQTLPKEIEAACLMLIRQAYFLRGIDPSIILEVTEGIGRTGYNKAPSTGLDDGMKEALVNYRSQVW